MVGTTPAILFPKSGNVEIVRALKQRNALFLVIGGTAVAVHGCRSYEDVDDLDLMIEPSIENAQRFVTALHSKGVSAPFGPEALARPAVQVPIKLHHYWLDILTPERQFDFASLLDRAIDASLAGMVVSVVARSDLISLKETATARLASDLSKHHRDLDCLKAT